MSIKKYVAGLAFLPFLTTLICSQIDVSKNNNIIENKSHKRVQPLHMVFGADSAGSGLQGETPASLACVYGLTSCSSGCNPAIVTQNPQGGWGTIAIVDAYHDPTAENDLNVFSRRFGLPECTTANGYFKQISLSQETPPPRLILFGALKPH